MAVVEEGKGGGAMYSIQRDVNIGMTDIPRPGS